MATWWRRPVDRVTYLVGAVGFTAVAVNLAAPAREAAPETVVVPISTVALVCPALPGATDGLSVALKGTLRTGEESARLHTQSMTPVHRTLRSGAIATMVLAQDATGYANAEGAAAQELVADSSLYGTTPQTRGYATAACQPPSAGQWLVGGSTLPGHSTSLFIANVDDTPAVVDVDVWTDKGHAVTRSLRSLTIPAQSRKRISMTTVEPGRSLYAVQVQALSGQVAAALVHDAKQALASLGIDIVATSGVPAREVRVGVLPTETRGAALGIVSPTTAATASVSIVSNDGEYVLAGYENIELEAGRLARVDVPDDAFATAATLVVRSTHPVIAGASLALASNGGTDVASAAALQPVNRSASLTIDGSIASAYALLTATRDTTVRVRVFTGARSTTQTALVRADRITRVRLVNATGPARLVSVEPAIDGVLSGSVLLTRVAGKARATSLQPLVSVQGVVAVPPIEPAIAR